MSNDSTTSTWQPEVLGIDILNDRFRAYLVRAPFDMPASASQLVDRTVFLEGGIALVRGVLSKVPSGPIRQGEMITLLARQAQAPELAVLQ